MNLSTAPLSPFQIPHFKNAKVVKREITPFLQNIKYYIQLHTTTLI